MRDRRRCVPLSAEAPVPVPSTGARTFSRISARAGFGRGSRTGQSSTLHPASHSRWTSTAATMAACITSRAARGTRLASSRASATRSRRHRSTSLPTEVTGLVFLSSTDSLQLDISFTAGSGGALSSAEIYIGLSTPAGLFWVDPAQGFTSTLSRAHVGPLGDFSLSPWLTLGPGALRLAAIRGSFWSTTTLTVCPVGTFPISS